ncbi:response regulator [Chitinimonas koreensis]|uniref:response regulator n=1 Tax=Chitinimonas koreensis TaxID=356302 RepID=UPI00223FAD70|nr:response regulator [Chitinimonas koreensis]
MNADRPFILLVAESAALRSMLAASLAELGYHHRTAGPGEAVRCTVEADFGLALVALGETAGADDEALLAALAERQPKLAIVAVSAAAGERHAHALGLLGLVTIPVSPPRSMRCSRAPARPRQPRWPAWSASARRWRT